MMRFDGSSDDEHNMYDDLFYNFPLNAVGQKPKDKDQKPEAVVDLSVSSGNGLSEAAEKKVAKRSSV